MSIRRFFLILALVIFLGMVCVYQHSQSVKAGYEINRLLARRNELVEQNKAAEYALLEMKNPAFIKSQVALMELALVPPGETAAPTAVAQNSHSFSARRD